MGVNKREINTCHLQHSRKSITVLGPQLGIKAASLYTYPCQEWAEKAAEGCQAVVCIH